MTETKRWWQSKTIWGLAFAALIALMSQLGISPADEANLPPWFDLVLQFVGFLVAAYGRIVATRTIA